MCVQSRNTLPVKRMKGGNRTSPQDETAMEKPARDRDHRYLIPYCVAIISLTHKSVLLIFHPHRSNVLSIILEKQ